MQRLVLFDIDCTLIDAHGAGGHALIEAIDEVIGVRGGLDGYSFHGRTDPGIVIDLAMRWGAQEETARALIGECVVRYVELLRDEVEHGFVEVLPGVRDLVAALADDDRVLLGLLTGNVEEGARVKLAPTGMADRFALGAYASDSAYRDELPPIAVERAERLTGRRFAGKEIVILGDSPADIACGEALGVKTIAVATGRHSAEELAAHEPDHVFADLGDWQAVLAAILA